MTEDLPPVNDGSRPSRLDLARHATGELALPGVVDDPYLRALEAERARVEPFDFEVLRARAARLDDPAPAPRPAPPRPRPWGALLAALAAVAVTVVLLPDLRPTPPPPPPEEGLKGPSGGGKTLEAPPTIPDPSPMAAERLGGAMSTMPESQVGTLSFLVVREGKQSRGTWSTKLQEGDLVGFRAFAARYDQVWLVTVDPAGGVAPLDPRAGFAPTPIEPDQRVNLGVHFAVTPPVRLLVLAFFGEWTEARVRATVSERWAAGGADALVALADAEDDVAVVKLETE